MAQNISDNIRTAAPKPLDDKWGMFEALPVGWRPFNDLTEFNSVFPLASRFNNMTFWVKSATDDNKSDLYSLRKDKTPYKILGDVELALSYELITFTDAVGLITIDFSINNRLDNFPRPRTMAYNVDGEVETEINGYLPTITRVDGEITELTLDGIFGDGYILLTN